ncbi:MAG: hypothetical protein ACK56F_26125, partial [bacterium]
CREHCREKQTPNVHSRILHKNIGARVTLTHEHNRQIQAGHSYNVPSHKAVGWAKLSSRFQSTQQRLLAQATKLTRVWLWSRDGVALNRLHAKQTTQVHERATEASGGFNTRTHAAAK